MGKCSVWTSSVLAAPLCLAAAVGSHAGAAAANVTFTRDVAPILQRSCLRCHRPGEVAPMSLATYGEVRPWARSIREMVVSRQMPPWEEMMIGWFDFTVDGQNLRIQTASR